MTTVYDYFAAPGPITNPGKHAGLLDQLPTDMASLCRVVQGLMIHIFWLIQSFIYFP